MRPSSFIHLLAVLAFASACNQGNGAKGDGIEKEQKTTAMTNGNDGAKTIHVDRLRDASGKIADVYVLEFNKTLLYVPASWFPQDTFADPKNGWRVRDDIGPPMKRDESPGIIHHVDRGARVQLYLRGGVPRPDVPPNFPVGRIHLKNIAPRASSHPPGRSYGSPNEFGGPYGPPDEFGWARLGKGDYFADFESTQAGGAPKGVTAPSLASVRDGHPPSHFHNGAGVKLGGDVSATYFWLEQEAPEPQWRALRTRMTKLMDWLGTAPYQRNNETIP